MTVRIGLLILFAIAAFIPAAQALPPASCGTAFCIVDLDTAVYLDNNTWGAGGATGSQSISATTATAWSTTWDWERPENNQVTSYAAAIRGWHTSIGFHFTPASVTGLPLPVQPMSPVMSTTAFTLTLDGTRTNIYDISYDLWFHTQSLPTGSSVPAFELMIWLARSPGINDWHSPVATPTIGGIVWDVFRNSSTFYTVVVQGANLTGATLDLREFIAYGINQGWLSSTWYLTSIEFGAEIFKGKGTLSVSQYATSFSAASRYGIRLRY